MSATIKINVHVIGLSNSNDFEQEETDKVSYNWKLPQHDIDEKNKQNRSLNNLSMIF